MWADSSVPDGWQPVIIAARRTPIGTIGQRLGGVPVAQLAAVALRATLDDASAALGSRPAVADVVLGNCMGPGGNIARVAALAASLGEEVPGMTIDRQCGSGLAAIIAAAEATVASAGSAAALRLAGGAESASTAPIRIARDSIGGSGYTRAPFAPPGFPDPEMGPAAETLARLRSIDRQRQDDYALRSHQRAWDAAGRGVFDAELVTVGTMTHDDGPRRMTAATLARFAPAFTGDAAATGTVTAGNSCRISDGAAAVAIVPELLRQGAPGLALIASATVGCDPAVPGLGPVAAVDAVLARAGVTLDDVAAIEIVEAFAAQVLAATDALGLSSPGWVDDRLCSDGGAIALGHPWGASGAVSVVRLFTRLVRSGAPAGTLGLATAAIGGGMGVAGLFLVVR